MHEQDVSKYVVKYCSTMDSTPRGNIGPVVDAVMRAQGQRVSIVVPSYPDNGRTVRDGVLYVDGVPLAESPMRHHPITPMRESEIAQILESQTEATVSSIVLEDVRSGQAASIVRRLREASGYNLAVIDAVSNADIRSLREIVSDLPVVTGGAALALALASPPPREVDDALFSTVEGPRVILSGSASAATQAQVRHAMQHMPATRLEARSDLSAQVDRIVAGWISAPKTPALVYATSQPSDVDPASASSIEGALADLAERLVAAGARQVMVAGGETSGAVVQRLGLTHLDLGEEIAPGVLWGSGRTGGDVLLNLALKSGNFGSADMFTSAWELL